MNQTDNDRGPRMELGNADENGTRKVGKGGSGTGRARREES